MKEAFTKLFNSLSKEQLEKIKGCKNADEVFKVLGHEGVELPDGILDFVTGGYISFEDGFWNIIDDKTGEVWKSIYQDPYDDSLEGLAGKYAEGLCFSKEKISPEQAKALREKYAKEHPLPSYSHEAFSRLK